MFVIELAAAKGSGQDRARVVEIDDALVIALADGAGGTSNGTAAADAIVSASAREPVLTDYAALIEDLDAELGGQSTAVILIAGAIITGASVGDSGAWLIREADIVDLTHAQHHKPLVGDGCIATVIEPVPFEGTLLVASDGLLSYAKRDDIARIVRGNELAAAARALIELVRLPNGALQDDVTVILANRTSSAIARSTAAPR